MSTIINPMTGKPVTIRIAKMKNGIAGRTKDSTPDNMTVYIDPIVPEGMYPALIVHECCELKHLVKGDKWETSHRAATETEHKFVDKLGADWDAYNRNYVKMLNKVKSRGNSIKNPKDILEGSSGERPSAGATDKGADVADVVPLAPLGGQKPNKPKIVGDCRTSDGKRTNCGNMPVVEKEVSRDAKGVCRDENGKWAGGCSSGSGSGSSSSKPGTSKPSGKKPDGKQQTGNQQTGNQQTGGSGKETTQPAPRRNTDLPPWMRGGPEKTPEAPKEPKFPLTEKLPKLEPGQMKKARPIPGFNRHLSNTHEGIEIVDKPLHPHSERKFLEPLVGHQIDFEYTMDEIMTPAVQASGRYRGHIPLGSVCINNMSFIDANGEKHTQDKLHMWFVPDQPFPDEFKDPKNLKQRMTGSGVVGEYNKKDKKDDKPKYKDMNIKLVQNVKRKTDTKKAFTDPFPEGEPEILFGGELARAIQLDIAAEHDAAALYMAHAEKVQDPEIRGILERVAREELVHIGEFEYVLDILSGGNYSEALGEGVTEASGNKMEDLTKADHHSRDFLDAIHGFLHDTPEIDEDMKKRLISYARGYAGGKAKARNRINAMQEENPTDDEEKLEDYKVEKSVYSKIKKVDTARRWVTGVVLEPDSVDLQDDRISAEDVRKAMEGYMIKSQQVGLQHSGKADASVVECYLAPCDFILGVAGLIKKGSWVMTTKIHDDSLWQKVLKGEIGGYSIGGSGYRTPE